MPSSNTLLRSEATDPEVIDWLGRVTALAPLIEQHRDSADRQRVTGTEVMDAVRTAGLHRIWISREFGGEELSSSTGIAVIQALARLDGSLAWQIAVQAVLGRVSDFLPESTSRKLFQDSSGLVIGGVNPAGSAEIVDGGFRLSGRWVSASGYAHADWMLCTAFVTEAGRRQRLESGAPDIRMLLVPRSETVEHDSWHTLGLRGTGSNDFTVPGTLVPEEFTVPRDALFAPPPARPSRGYGLALFDSGPLATAATALGIAQDALASFYQVAMGKTAAGGTIPLTESHVAQDKTARFEMLLRSSEVLLGDTTREAVAHAEDGGDALSALIRATAATVAENSVTAVNGLFQLAGMSSLFSPSRLERCLRDINSVTKHITLSPLHFETVGQYLLGGPLLYRR
jgi:alkylation response protein AidB-like acyl-CoA dehydrogenase